MLQFQSGNFEEGFEVTQRIDDDDDNINFLTKRSGKFPPNSDIPELYGNCYPQHKNTRLIPGEGSSFNSTDNDQEFLNNYQEFLNHLREWVKGNLRDQLLIKCHENEPIRVIIQTNDSLLKDDDSLLIKKLPWHESDLFPDIYTKTEFALSSINCDNPIVIPYTPKVRILAILGNNKGIDINKDHQFLENLLPPRGAYIEFKEESKLEDISDNLWEKNWDILFFAGHSSSQGKKGVISINPTDSLTIEELKNGLRRAIKGGLQLAIFNSCDGLKLADDLAELNIPQIIVMREPVPDKVAPKFLKFFLDEYSKGESLYLAMRHARERLHENLDKDFPGASWLPVIYQNPTVQPPTWSQLGGGFPIKKWINKQTFTHNEDVTAMCINSDNKIIIFDGKKVKTWNLQTHKPINTEPEHLKQVKDQHSKQANNNIISDNGQFSSYITDNKLVIVDNLHTKESHIIEIPREHSDKYVVGKPLGFFTNSDDEIILVTGSKNQGAFWYSKNGILHSVYTITFNGMTKKINLCNPSTLFAISPDGQTIAITGKFFNNKIYIFR